MNNVHPIREKSDIEMMKLCLGRDRDRLLFIVGINSALRISDILKLKVGDVRGKTSLTVQETKTSKRKTFRLNAAFLQAVETLVPPSANDDDYLFQSRTGVNKPITRVQAYRILNDAARRAGIEYEIGTHTLRKTFAFFAYKAGVDLAVLQSILNHASQRETLRYIGIVQDDIDDVYISVSL